MKTLQEYLNESLNNEINENFIWNKLKQFWKWLMSEEDDDKYKKMDFIDVDINDLTYEVETFDEFVQSHKSFKKIESQLSKEQKLTNLSVLEVLDKDEEMIISLIYVNTPIDLSKADVNINWGINILAAFSKFGDTNHKRGIYKMLKTIKTNVLQKNHKPIDGFIFSETELVDQTIINTLGIHNNIYDDNKGHSYYYLIAKSIY